jgi:sugar lactone lactonase YvrE
MRVTVRLAGICLLTTALIACLTACNLFNHSTIPSSPNPYTPLPRVTMNYAVADIENYRVLIYDTAFSTDESASVVLGQADFVSNSSLPISAKSVEPGAIAVDSSSNLYVADANTCRVLLFKPPFTNNMAASVVIGEPDFTTNGCGISASTLDGVEAMAIDGDGDLWVSDTSSRIVEFVPPFTNGMAASLVIGQASPSSSSGCNHAGTSTASTLCFANGLTFDSSGNLWVSDTDNNRVLEFKPPFSNNMAASLELGQPSGATAFTSDTANNGGVSATSLDSPYQLAFDGDGNLWVPDIGNRRVLEYVPPFSNGMAATLELGQPSGATAFTSHTANNGQSGFDNPPAVTFDSSGNIQVVDYGNSRVMIFEPPFSNGMNATLVLGQADFTHGAANQGGSVAADTLYWPGGGVTF